MRSGVWLTGCACEVRRLFAAGRSAGVLLPISDVSLAGFSALRSAMSLFHRFAGYGLALLAFLISAEAGFGQTNTVLTTLGQVQALTLDEARKGHPVKVRASVTYSDPEWMMMFVQDGSGSTFVERNRPYNDPSWSLLPGHVVLLEGVTSAGLTQANVRETKFEMTDEMAVLVPKTLDGEAGAIRTRPAAT